MSTTTAMRMGPRAPCRRGPRSASGRVLLGIGRDLRMGREPDAGTRLRVADQLFDDPDARAIADDMRMRGDLADTAILVSGVELAFEDAEHGLRRHLRAQPAEAIHHEV